MLGNRKSAGASSKGKTETSKPKETETKGEKQCVDDCELKTGGSMTQCNLCMLWCHGKCIGIKKSDNVGWWCCDRCKQMAANVSI